MITPNERAKQLTEAHWNGYVKPLLEAHGECPEIIESIGFHYRSSGVHFYLHSIEDERNGMFWEESVADEYIDRVALEAELDRSCGDPEQDMIHRNRTITKAVICPTCYDEKQCGGSFMNAKGECLHHRPKGKAEKVGSLGDLMEQMIDANVGRKASLCWTCTADQPCSKQAITQCEDYGYCSMYVDENAAKGVHISEWYAKEEAKNRADREPSLCDTCHDEECDTHGIMAEHGSCNRYDPGPARISRKASLCHSCNTDVNCSVQQITQCEGYGHCSAYVPALRERMMEAKEQPTAKQDAPKTDDPSPPHTDPATNCADCGNAACAGIGRNLTCDQGCERFAPKGEV